MLHQAFLDLHSQYKFSRILFLVALFSSVSDEQAMLCALKLFFFCTFTIKLTPLLASESLVFKPSQEQPLLGHKTSIVLPQCNRYFIYRGQRNLCDSYLGHDGQNLYSIIQKAPQALQEFETYQKNQKTLRHLAYFTATGFFTMTLGLLIYQTSFYPKHQLPNLSGLMMLLGGGMTLSSLIYTWSLSKNNETHLHNAVHYYNLNYPTDPIQLQFSAPFHF